MGKKVSGLLAALALAIPAFATTNDMNSSQALQNDGTLPRELQGKVVGVRDGKVLIQGPSGVMPLEVNRNTYFGGPGLVSDADAQQRAQTVFKEGQDVRASFTVQNKDNVATSIFAEPSYTPASSNY